MINTQKFQHSEDISEKIYQLRNDFQLDFNKLALENPSLLKHVIILGYKTVINFKKQQSLIELTKAIMRSVFCLQWKSLDECLCPRIPNRLNYLLWINRYSEIDIKNVIDIGTGASLIYPLIGCKVFDWSFSATEIDQLSLKNAKYLVKSNSLQDKIKIIKGSQDYFLKQVINNQQKYDILLCNPPFFDNENFMSPLGTMKQREHRIQGGQYQFFFKLYLQSLYYENINTFSIMVGRNTTFQEIKTFLKQEVNYNICQKIKFGKIHQGNNTRFIILWKVNQKLAKSTEINYLSK